MRSDDPPAGLDVGSDPYGPLEHTANIQFCEVAISHSLQEMRTDFELPLPPLGPSLHVAGGLQTRAVRYCLTPAISCERIKKKPSRRRGMSKPARQLHRIVRRRGHRAALHSVPRGDGSCLGLPIDSRNGVPDGAKLAPVFRRRALDRRCVHTRAYSPDS